MTPKTQAFHRMALKQNGYRVEEKNGEIIIRENSEISIKDAVSDAINRNISSDNIKRAESAEKTREIGGKSKDD